MGFEIDASTKNIQDLADKFYEVPDYQREYVWVADDHVQRFLDDINDEFEPTGHEQSKYFIGSIIIVKKEQNSTTFDVIDGQQRLTTIVLCLCSIRRLLKSLKTNSNKEERERDGLSRRLNDILLYYSTEDVLDKPRLKLQYEDSRDFLDKLIIDNVLMDEQPMDSIKKMREAFLTIDQFFNTMADNSSSEFLAFVRYFITKIELVVISPDSLSGALKIFETINERGVGLNAMDLLKNLLFASANKRDFELIKNEWKEMTNSIEDAGESGKPLRFLRYFLMAKYHDGVIREDALYRWISSNKGKEEVGYENNPVLFAKELKKYAEKYRQFIKATEAKERDVNYPSLTGIGHLLRKNSRQHLVLLMALDSSLDKSIVNRLAEALEILSFYYATNRVLTKTYERQFAKWATIIRNLKSEKALENFIQTELFKEIEEQRRAFSTSFGTKSRGNILPQYRIKFILGEIDNFIRRASNLSENSIKHFQGLEIEHILPQTPVNMPKEKFEDMHIYANWTERIGNLTLLEAPINQSIGKANDLSTNEWFGKKLNGYKSSSVELTKTLTGDTRIGQNSRYNQFVEQHLNSYDKWGTEQIEDRQDMQKKLMMEVWKLNSTSA